MSVIENDGLMGIFVILKKECIFKIEWMDRVSKEKKEQVPLDEGRWSISEAGVGNH